MQAIDGDGHGVDEYGKSLALTTFRGNSALNLLWATVLSNQTGSPNRQQSQS